MDVIVPHVASSLGTPTVFVQIVGSTAHTTPGIPITGIVNTDIDAITYAFEESIPTVRTTIGSNFLSMVLPAHADRSSWARFHP